MKYPNTWSIQYHYYLFINSLLIINHHKWSITAESIHYIENTYGFDNTPNLNILCTGSLHLIGGILNIFQNEYYIDDVV